VLKIRPSITLSSQCNLGTDTVAKENKYGVVEMKLLRITAGHSITDRRRKFIA
jgi:hypothetical protein